MEKVQQGKISDNEKLNEWVEIYFVLYHIPYIV